jgi:hypothetical protein
MQRKEEANWTQLSTQGRMGQFEACKAEKHTQRTTQTARPDRVELSENLQTFILSKLYA